MVYLLVFTGGAYKGGYGTSIIFDPFVLTLNLYGQHGRSVNVTSKEGGGSTALKKWTLTYFQDVN